MVNEIEVEGAAEGYVELFNRIGIDYIFSSPGSEFVPIWEYLAKYNSQGKGPLYINTRHEGLSLSLAKGYTMATGRGQIVMTHVLTGLLHGAMELKAMYTDNLPLLLIVGQNRTHDDEIYGGTPGPHYLSFTEVGGQQMLVQPYVKWTDAPDSNANILGVMKRAIDIASTDIKGPVLISLSRELLFEKTKKMRMPPRSSLPTRVQSEPNALMKLADLLSDSDNPIIYTRYLGRNPNTVPALVELAELLSIPVFETPGYMNFPTDHRLHLGYDASPYLPEADLVLVIDSSGWPPWYPPSKILRDSDAKIVFMDLDPLQVKYSTYGYPSDMLITADSSLAIPSLAELLKSRITDASVAERIKNRGERWPREHRRIREGWARAALKVNDEKPINAKWLCLCINEVLDEGFAVVHETISYGSAAHTYIEANRRKPGTWFEAAGPVAHTGLGQGLGMALGIKLAEPKKTVVALEGDGSFNYNPVAACYGFAQEYCLPFLTIIFDNQSYASMKHHQRYYPEGWSAKSDIYYGVYCKPKPDYAKLAEAFGGYSETVEEPGDVKPALTRALSMMNEGRFSLLDIMLKQP